MHFAVICLDKPGQGSLRADTRPAHLDHLNAHRDRILVAGPMLGDDGRTPVGSLIVLDLADIDEARAFADGDPYNVAGLFESVTVRPWRQVLP